MDTQRRIDRHPNGYTNVSSRRCARQTYDHALAAAFGMPTHHLVDAVSRDPLARTAVMNDATINTLPGGVPVRDGDVVVGGLASEIAAGEVKDFACLDGRVGVFRGTSEVAQELNPFCRHLGVDLAICAVVRDDLRCAYHHCRYHRSGL